jgi:Na+/melibiose symporter-like transporter
LLPTGRPARLLVAGSLIVNIGLGIFTSGGILFFVRSAGLTAGQVALGLSVGGVFALCGNVGFGALADRYGPRRTVILLGLVQSVALSACAVVHSLPGLVAVVAVLRISEQAAVVCQNTLVSQTIGAARRVAVAAYLRAALNVGFAIGAALSCVATLLDTHASYQTLLLFSGILSAAGFLLYLRLPALPRQPVEERTGGQLAALRNWPYVLAGVMCGVVTVGDSILVVGLPLWIVGHTTVPRFTAPLLIGLNSVLVMLLQVRAARGADTIRGATHLVRTAAAVALLGCLTLWAAGSLPLWAAVAMLLAGTVLLTASELWISAASWKLAFELAPPDSQGAHLGVFSLGTTLSVVYGPALVSALVVGFHGSGWPLFAVLFLPAYLGAGPLIARAERRGLVHQRHG